MKFANLLNGALHYTKNELELNLNPENILAPKKGRLLLSKPFLDDPYFKRTVILLCDHDEDGSFGFILNKFMDPDLSKDFLTMPNLPRELAIGGPVETENIYYIHRFGDQMEGSIHLMSDLYLGGSFEDLKTILKTDNFDLRDIRFFIGYSGWDANQLEEELDLESWYVADSEGIDFMDYKENIEDLWSQVLKTMGGDFVNLANFPEDPKLN